MIIDGKKQAEIIRNEIKKEISDLKKKSGKTPSLTVILIGEFAPSLIYVKNKEKSAREVGINSEIIRYSKNVSEKDILNLEKSFLETKYLVTGTILLSSPISAETIFFLIEQAKKFKVKIVIDLNWREVFWDHSSFSLEISKAERVYLIKKFS